MSAGTDRAAHEQLVVEVGHVNEEDDEDDEEPFFQHDRSVLSHGQS